MEADLEEECKQHTQAAAALKKLESDLAGMQEQVETATKVKEDSIKQLRRLQVSDDMEVYIYITIT